MAVTLTQSQLSAALRLGTSAEEVAEATRLLALRYRGGYPTRTTRAGRRAKRGGDPTRRISVRPTVRGHAAIHVFANALRNSGAARMLLPYRIHRAGSTAEAVADAQAAVGSVDNPVIDVSIVSGELVVTFADGTTEKRRRCPLVCQADFPPAVRCAIHCAGMSAGRHGKRTRRKTTGSTRSRLMWICSPLPQPL